MKIAYFDCFAGAGGDMIVAAMLDAGLDSDFLANQINSLALEGVKLEISKTMRCGMAASTFKPLAPKQHHYRNLSYITQIINDSGITPSAKQRAIDIFNSIAVAEAAVHGTTPDEIHFHEIGAVDSIVDIVAACVGFDALEIEKTYCSQLSVGKGIIKCAHGLMPAPAPATLELLKTANAPISGGPGDTELLTPTAAAILVNFVDEFAPMPPMTIDSIGCGAGTMDSKEFPNILRLIVGRSSKDSDVDTDTIALLETNIDDATGETVGFVMDKLFEKGVLDAFTTPIQMKRNRPAVKLSVICEISDVKKNEQLIFEEGMTFGIRKQFLQRSKLKRDFVNVQTEFGSIRIKVGFLDGKVANAKPEHSDCAEAAKRHNIALKAVSSSAMTAFSAKQKK